MDIPQAEAAVDRTGCMTREEEIGRIVRFVREGEHIGPGSMDRLMRAGTVAREARLGRTILVAPKQ
jgi:hypothetical protein